MIMGARIYGPGTACVMRGKNTVHSETEVSQDKVFLQKVLFLNRKGSIIGSRE